MKLQVTNKDIIISFSAGSSRFVVRRHDRFGTIGPNTVLRATKQNGQCVYSVV